MRELLIDELGRDGFHMRDARTLADALQRIGEQRPDMVVLDLSLPDSFGLETLFRIQSQDALLPIVVLTGNEDQALALAAVKAGAQDFLVKQDLSGRLLVKTLQYARERKHNEARLRVSEARFRSLAELSSDWYWEQDAEHRLTYLSEGLLEKSGVDPAALLGRRGARSPRVVETPRGRRFERHSRIRSLSRTSYLRMRAMVPRPCTSASVGCRFSTTGHLRDTGALARTSAGVSAQRRICVEARSVFGGCWTRAATES
jgi:CheY-like chemotaxis protein